MSTQKKYIIVLAGGLDENGECHDFVKVRLDKAKEIYDENIKNNIQTNIICLGGGTYHKPPNLNNLNYVIHESTACAIYLVENGVDDAHIMREWSSYDTIANGFYCLVNFIIPLNITECEIVTSDFHMPRAKVIFDFFKKFSHNDIKILYTSVNDNMIPENIKEERKKREANSARNFIKTTENFDTLGKFVEWFHRDHDAYKAIVTYYPMDNKLKKTY